jgi:hypothetical protein
MLRPTSGCLLFCAVTQLAMAQGIAPAAVPATAAASATAATGAPAAAAPTPAAAATIAAPAGSPAEAVAGGKFHLTLRARIESVDEGPFVRHATAMTLRTHLAWQSATYQGFTLNLEADDVHALDEDGYNSTVNGATTRPVVGDPVYTEINVAALGWKSGNTSVTLGRQRLTLDNQRFVGNVGWRQNEQTYDGASVRLKPVPRIELTAAWIWNVNRVFGPRSGTQAADWHGDTALLNARLDAGKAGNVALFGYSMRFANAAAVSNSTLGASWTGAATLGAGWKLPWAFVLASQSDSGDNPTDYTAGYRQVEIGLARDPYALRIGQELLDGDTTRANRRFQTPLATLHAFQGWADKFLTTPPQGIDDRYVAASATLRGSTLQLQWHDYRAAAGSRSYGTEWNASIAHSFAKRYELLAKFADYRADGFASDTTKWWLMATATF